MKYCPNCGGEINENAVICEKCGFSVQSVNNTHTQTTSVDDSVNVGLVILAVLIPLFGIIYWPLNAKEHPKCAQACGIASIIAWVIYLAYILAVS